MTTGSTVLESLYQRLHQVAEVLLDAVPELPAGSDPDGTSGDQTHPDDAVSRQAATLLDAVVRSVSRTMRRDEVWLLFAAVTGRLPLADDVDDLARTLELAATTGDAELWLLDRATELSEELGVTTRPLRVARDAVLVDVSFSAQYDKHTGIQRVTREVCSRWAREHTIELTAWTPDQRSMRSLTDAERGRVLTWTDAERGTAPESIKASAVPDDVELVLPWHCTVVLPEVAQGVTAGPLAALAQDSGSTVAAIGYDAIPVVSADLRPVPEPNQFVCYLTVVKHARRVAGISSSATAEFRGFADAVRAQGLPGPQVAEVMLAAEVPPPPGPAAGDGSATADADGHPPSRPSVLCVGSHEPHKNHVALLHAAELLWREGLDFDLTFVGGRGWDTTELDALVTKLTRAGRPVTKVGSVTDDELWAMYRNASFTVFPSLHEGFGLPVAESLACGTPVVTTRYGSTAEIARRGGCLLVDPRDDHDIRDAVRRLLTDPELLADLTEQARSCEGRTWDTYAGELWRYLVEGEEPR